MLARIRRLERLLGRRAEESPLAHLSDHEIVERMREARARLRATVPLYPGAPLQPAKRTKRKDVLAVPPGYVAPERFANLTDAEIIARLDAARRRLCPALHHGDAPSR